MMKVRSDAIVESLQVKLLVGLNTSELEVFLLVEESTKLMVLDWSIKMVGELMVRKKFG